MFNDEQGLYTIGIVAALLDEHPETLRVWERNGLLTPARFGKQRRYSNEDVKKLKFIKYMLDEKGLNIAGIKQLISMYICWNNRYCPGGAMESSQKAVNESKPCWKIEGTFCLKAADKSEICASCQMLKNCRYCKECG